MRNKSFGYWVVALSLLIVLILVSACQPSLNEDSPTGQGASSTEGTSSSAGVPDQGSGESAGNGGSSESGGDPMVIAQEEWQSSAHASSFVVDGQGNNNSCARCHAPKNWAPTLADIPDSCAACKFELPEPPPFIEESAWTNVSCVMCHTIDKKGNVEAEIAWLEIPALDEYASVESPSDLCLNCHITEGIAQHGLVSVGSGHEDMLCLECHSPHSTSTSCVTGDCHAGVMTEEDQLIGHDEDHKDVSCAACHDNAGWDVGPHPETGIWTTFSSWTLVGGEGTILESGSAPFLSHDLGLAVNCERCHFSGNTWGLTENVDSP